MPAPSIAAIRWQDAPGLLPAQALWGREPGSRRSRELTPLFVHRYVGPHSSRVLGVHECWELIYVFRGSGVLHATAPYPFKTGFAYLLPPRTPHREEAAAPMDTLWIGLRGSCLAAAPRREPACVECPSLAPLLEQLWLRADRRFGLIGPELDGLARAALGRFVRALGERHPREQDLLDQAAAYLHHSFSGAVSIADLAARFGFSEGYFYRAFKRRTGMTPVTYLTKVRIENALKLLRHSSLSVSRVARLVGYQDPLYFSRIFRKVTGQSPRAGRLGSRRPARG